MLPGQLALAWQLPGGEQVHRTGQRQHAETPHGQGSWLTLKGTAPDSFDRGFGHKIWTVGLKRVLGTNIDYFWYPMSWHQ